MPDQVVNEDQYSLDNEKIVKFYENLITTGQLTAEQLGSRDDFVMSMKEEGSLLKFRSKMLDSGIFNENQLYSDPNDFYQTFVKKKDQQSHVPTGTTSKSVEKEELDILKGAEERTFTRDEVQDFWSDVDASQIDYQNETTDDQADEFATKADNVRFNSSTDPVVVSRIKKEEAKIMNQASNDIIKNRDLNFSYNRDKGGMQKYFDESLKTLDSVYNSGKLKGRKKSLRNVMYEAHAEPMHNAIISYANEQGYSKYDMVMHPHVMDGLKEHFSKLGLPGEVWDKAANLYMSDMDAVIRENEIYHISSEIQKRMEDGSSGVMAAQFVADQINSESDNRVLETFSGKDRKRLDLLAQRQALLDNPTSSSEQLRKVEAAIGELGDFAYDRYGRRIGTTESKDQDIHEAGISAEIDNILQLPSLKEASTFQQNLYDLKTQRYLNLRNTERRLSEVRDELKALGRFTLATPQKTAFEGTQRIEDDFAKFQRQEYLKNEEEHLIGLRRNAQIGWEAAARMYTLNENPTGRKKFMTGYYAQEGWDVIKDLNPFMFDPMKDKSTRAQRAEQLEGMLDELGYEMTDEEREFVESDYMLELTRSGAAMTDFVVKMAAVSLATRGLGTEAAIARMAGRTQRILNTAYSASKWKGAKVAGSKALKYISQEVAGAGLEGIKFGIASGDMKEIPTGAMFYGFNRLMPGLNIKDPKMNTIINTMYKSSAGMTLAMEGTAAFHAAIDSMKDNKQISTAIEELYGGGVSENVKRLTIEMATGLIFGVGSLYQAKRAGAFRMTPKDANEAFQVAVKNDKLDLAADISNQKFNILEKNEAYIKGKSSQSKYEYLRRHLKPEELKELADKKGLNPEKIDQRFDEIVKNEAKDGKRNEVDIWEEVLGKDSVETVEQKRRALEKITGKDMKKHTLGDIEAIYERMRIDKNYAVKLREEMRVAEKQKRFETKEQRIAEESEAAKKLVGVEEGRAVSSEAGAAKLEKKPGSEVSKVQKEHVKEVKNLENDLSPKRIRRDINRYKKTTNTNSKRSLMNDIASNLRTAIYQAANSNIPRSNNQYKQLLRALKSVEKSINTNEMPTATQAERLYKSIEQGLNLFTPDNITKRVNRTLDDVVSKKKEGGRVVERKYDLSTDFLTKMIKSVFSGDQAAMSKLSERVNSAMEALEKDADLYDPVNIERFGAVRNAITNGKNRETALRRRAELQVESQNRELTNMEMLEYELLNFRDAASMSAGELAIADATLKNILNNGHEIKRTQSTFEVLQKRNDVNIVQKMLSPQRYMSSKALQEARSAVTDTQKLQFLQRYGKDTGKLVKKGGKYDRKAIDAEYAKAVREHHKLAEQLRQKEFRKMLRAPRIWIESFPTLMEYLSMKMPGRMPFEGHLHSFSDQILGARTGKQNELSYWAKQQAHMLKNLFGDSKTAEKTMKKWSKVEHDFYITDNKTGVALPERMTVQEALTLHQYAQQRDLASTFERRDWEVTNEAGGKGKFVVELENQIREFGGQEALDWSNWMVTDLYPRLYHRLNEKYRQHKGTDLDYIVNYSPVYRKIGEVKGEERALFDKPVEDYIASTMTSSSKMRTDAKEWFDLRGVNENMNAHIERMVHYIHFQDPVLRLQRVFDDGAVRETIEAEYGGIANKVLDKFRKDMSQDIFTGDRWKSLDKLRANFVRAKLGFNLLLFPKQMMSVNAYASELRNPGENAAFYGHLFTPDFKLMKQLSRTEYFKARYSHSTFNRDLALQEQKFAVDLARESADRAKMVRGHSFVDAMNPFGGHLKDNMLLMTKLGDGGAILYGGQAMYRVAVKRYTDGGYTPKEAQQMAMNDFIRGTRKTQQSGVTEDLSHLQRAGSWGKMLTLFQNTPMQYLRIELAALDAMAQAQRDGDKKKMAKSIMDFITYHIVLPTTFHAASNGFYIDDLLDPDKGFDAKWWEDTSVMTNTLVGGLRYAPILGHTLVTMSDLMNTGFAYEGGVGILGDVLKEEEKFLKYIAALSHGDEEITAEGIVKAAGVFATVAGVPLHSLYNIGDGIADFASGETHDVRALMGYSPAMRGEYLRSPDYNTIHKHLPIYGGSIEGLFTEVIDKEGYHYFNRNKDRLTKEFIMYEKYGGNDRHVNFLYTTLDNPVEKAEYIHDLYKLSVEGKRPLMRKNRAVVDIFNTEELSEDQFMQRLAEWKAYGVISNVTLKMFIAKREGKFEELYEK